jgi:hypothetical protein
LEEIEEAAGVVEDTTGAKGCEGTKAERRGSLVGVTDLVFGIKSKEGFGGIVDLEGMVVLETLGVDLGGNGDLRGFGGTIVLCTVLVLGVAGDRCGGTIDFGGFDMMVVLTGFDTTVDLAKVEGTGVLKFGATEGDCVGLDRTVDLE